MAKKKTRLDMAREAAQIALNNTNRLINQLGEADVSLYNALSDLQYIFGRIVNVPLDMGLKYEQVKRESLNWKQQAQKIEDDFNAAAIKNAGKGVAGVGAGVAVAAMGPNMAMAFATIFGVASTGTPIAALGGAAAYNAALAWLGGGALAAGGGGMVAGEAFLGLLGPVGWAVAGVALAGSGLMMWKMKSDRECLENIFVGVAKRDEKRYTLASTELSERITRIRKETSQLKEAVEIIKTFGLNYDDMTEQQQYYMGAFVNQMYSSNQLLLNPIMGLIPLYTNKDLAEYIDHNRTVINNLEICHHYSEVIIALANMFHGVHFMTDREKSLLVKTFSGNKQFLQSMNIKKYEMNFELMDAVFAALQFQYNKKKWGEEFPHAF